LIPEIRHFGDDIASGCDKKAKFMELAEKIMSAFSAIFRETKEVKLNLMILGKDKELRFLAFIQRRRRPLIRPNRFPGRGCRHGVQIWDCSFTSRQFDTATVSAYC